MNLTCTYIIKEVISEKSTIVVTYSLPGYKDVSVNLFIPDVNIDIDKYIQDQLPYMSWITAKPSSKLNIDLINKIGEATFDDSKLTLPTEEEKAHQAKIREAKRLIDLEFNINQVLLKQEEITL